jgi:sulfhydrogenase subunit alpha
VRFEVTEPPRFFESMLRGRTYDQAPLITSRICGICSNGHVLAAITAMENALDVTPSDQTMLLRRLLMHGETIQSHVLHAYFLVAPDFLGVGSVIPLVQTHPDVVKRALRMKKLGNDICDVIGGRAVHQIAAVVGGFTHLPERAQLLALRQRLDDVGPDLEATVALFGGLTMPEFDHPTEYLSLKSAAMYAYFGDLILSSNGDITPVRHYREKIKERVVPHSSAKHVSSDRNTFMVGALARANNGFQYLSDGAKQVAGDLGFAPQATNPYLNTVAQLIETVHCVDDARAIIDTLLATGLTPEQPSVEVREGHGVGAIEVPRGTLYHEYGVDRQGLITDANLIIPTGQNLANLESDMWALAPSVIPKGEAAAQLAMEMLVRAYDPCISCSTHVIYLDGDDNTPRAARHQEVTQ